jgi:type I restriction enzyme S subunit
MNWINSPLGEVTNVLSGTTPDSSKPAFWNGDRVWVTPADLGKLTGQLVDSSARKITALAADACNLPLIPTGAVVMSSRAPIGHLAVAGCDLYTNQGCKSFVCSTQIDPWFLYFTLIYRKPDLQASGSGATFAELSKSALEEFVISFPEDISQQRDIAQRLKLQLTEFETARRAAMQKATEISLLRRRLLANVFAGLEGVPLKELGDHAPTTSGSTPPRGDKRYWQPAEIPWVKTGEVAFAPISKTEEAISKVALAECSLTLLPRRTVLIAMYGQGKTRGQSAVLDIPATTNQACFAILPNKTWDPDFLFYWFLANYRELRSLSDDRGGNQANLNGALLKALKVPAPDLQDQLKIVHYIKAALIELDLMQIANKTILSDLRRLPQSLLSQAFEN